MGCCDHDDEPAGSMKCGEFIDWISNCQLFKSDCCQHCPSADTSCQ